MYIIARVFGDDVSLEKYQLKGKYGFMRKNSILTNINIHQYANNKDF